MPSISCMQYPTVARVCCYLLNVIALLCTVVHPWSMFARFLESELPLKVDTVLEQAWPSDLDLEK